MTDYKRTISFSLPDISELEIVEVAAALKSGWITTGPRTKQLERYPDILKRRKSMKHTTDKIEVLIHGKV